MTDKNCTKCNGTGYVMFNKCDVCNKPKESEPVRHPDPPAKRCVPEMG